MNHEFKEKFSFIIEKLKNIQDIDNKLLIKGINYILETNVISKYVITVNSRNFDSLLEIGVITNNGMFLGIEILRKQIKITTINIGKITNLQEIIEPENIKINIHYSEIKYYSLWSGKEKFREMLLFITALKNKILES